MLMYYCTLYQMIELGSNSLSDNYILTSLLLRHVMYEMETSLQRNKYFSCSSSSFYPYPIIWNSQSWKPNLKFNWMVYRAGWVQRTFYSSSTLITHCEMVTTRPKVSMTFLGISFLLPLVRQFIHVWNKWAFSP